LSRVLVTDASERAALAVIRSLGRKGIEVVAMDSRRFNAGFLSKYCSEAFIYPSPLKDKTKFIKSMLRFVRNEDFDLLIPITDFTLVPIVEYKDEFEDYVKVAAPPYEIAIKAFDKAQTIKIAKEKRIPCPKTFILEDFKELKKVARDLKYPVVIKPRSKVFWVNNKAVMLKVTSKNYAYNGEDLLNKYVKIISQLKLIGISHEFLLLQEFVKGEAYGVEILMHNSEPKAIFVHKRLREYPITGGASTLRISVRNDKLVQCAVKLLKEMDWQGVAMVEFKMDEENENFKLIEVNGRFWGSLPLAINAGVDFPYLLYKLMVEGDVSTVKEYKIGFAQRWLLPGDFLWLLETILRHGDASRFHAIRNFLSPPFKDDIISLNDFLPTLGVMFDILHGFVNLVKGRRTIYGELVA